jgi:2-oxoglutarate ferredoxin oxidoreductase subunit gamma
VPDTHKIILEGSGGQGIGLGGKILAEAAVAGGYNASQSQSYGAQARGGYSSAQVIISAQEIIFPLVDEPNIIIALTSQAYNRNKDLLKTGGLLLYNTEEQQPVLTGLTGCSPVLKGAVGLPFSLEARNTGNPKGITLLALGTLIGLTDIVNTENFEEAIQDNFTPKIAEANIDCFWQGLKLARTARKPWC